MAPRRRFSEKPPAAPAPWGADPLASLPPDPPANRKTLQLCKQVERTLMGVLAGETGDDVLRDLLVLKVVPAPDSSRLLAFVQYQGPESTDLPTILTSLADARALLRNEVAAAINRRKAPDLAFQVFRRA
jgi:ribosome-binding factor A